MNRVLRAGLLIPVVLFGLMAAAWFGSGGGGYGGSSEYYPMTVRMWMDDSFVGGIAPAITTGITDTAVLEMLAAGNDLVYVEPDAPRCPVMTVAWVRPDPGTPANAQVYSATIRCAQPDNTRYEFDDITGAANNNTVPPDHSMTFDGLRRGWGLP